MTRCQAITVSEKRCKLKCKNIFCHIHCKQEIFETNIVKEVKFVKEKEICSICLDPLKSSMKLANCAHSFCGNCIKPWICSNASCPNCRKDVNLEEKVLGYNYGLKNKILISCVQRNVQISSLNQDQLEILNTYNIYPGLFIKKTEIEHVINLNFYLEFTVMLPVKVFNIYVKCNPESWDHYSINRIYYNFI